MAANHFVLFSFFVLYAYIIVGSPVPQQSTPIQKRAPSGYAPVETTCPSTSLLREATGISASESAYGSARYAIASENLAAWLSTAGIDVSSSTTLPTVGLTTSGGGYRSLLTGAGVVQAFDSRDSNFSTNGLLQGATYQAGLSGGGWLLSSLIGNNYPTVSYLQDNLWTHAFADSLLIPGNILAAIGDYDQIIDDIEAKDAAGFDPSLTDPWGRLLSYQLLEGTDGGVQDTVSGITSLSNFVSHTMPYPIIAALGVNTFEGECLPEANATQYEFHPYEFGSWDDGVDAFVQIEYLGSALSNGQSVNGSCITNYDNLGYVLGTSSTLFNQFCSILPAASNSSNATIEEFITAMVVEVVEDLTEYDEFAKYPNPFYNYPPSSLIAAQEELYLVDGGESNQNNPLWPLLHAARGLDVILVNDNSADTNANFPNGSELYSTYLQALNNPQLATRMPTIPPAETFIASNLSSRATFFGCHDPAAVTLIYLPNVAYTYASGQPTAKLEYTPAETAAMIANGNAVATQNGTEGWAECLACGIMAKSSGVVLPAGCTDCLERYCYN